MQTKNLLIGVGIVVVGYLVLDALTTTNPAERRRDVRDLKIIGEGASAAKSIW